MPYGAVVLPPETVSEVFVWNEQRQRLWDSYLCFKRKLRDLLLVDCRYWIDGSFSTKKDNPGDIDIVVLIPYEEFTKNIDQLKLLRRSVADVDCYFVETFPPEHPRYNIAKADELTWYYFFRTDRRKRLKGFIEINW
ncbi:hypothetical protein BLX24_01985 [Arsenicibacter rosenii]|uniref:Polymerase nucleotidyl transferase domain-containing protein n=2 Tax=Arsenicibacter rosenii TaxID=1750698 RepID=A0A1S2VQ35_9BACT|nr:hypothetical protein BLX24_01985 [Arsenicibacter rosenii]